MVVLKDGKRNTRILIPSWFHDKLYPKGFMIAVQEVEQFIPSFVISRLMYALKCLFSYHP